MKLKRFESLTLQGALQTVKAELGPDAVIVSTRRIHKGKGLFGLMSQSLVEVTAAADRTGHDTRPFLRENKRWPGHGEERKKEERKEEDRVEISSPPSPLKPSSYFDDQLRMATMLDPLTQQVQAMREEVRRLMEEQGNQETIIGPVKQEIEGLRLVIGEALGDQMRRKIGTLPGELGHEYEALVGVGVNPQVAHDLLRSVVEVLGTAGLSQPGAVRELLLERMEEVVSVSGPLVPARTSRNIVMLVGPTGVGKTTTVAKLASWALQGDRSCKTVLVTLDTYRIAAVEQLRVFAKLLKVPLEVAVSPKDLVGCLDRHRDADLILIDTTGRSPHDRTGQEELAAIERQNLKIDTHLVLSAPTAEPVLQEVIRQYRRFPIHRLLFTKLDEVRQCGHLFNLLHETGIPLSYLSAGQRVPEDLELATKRRAIELLGLPTIQEQVANKQMVGA